jgi:hypothetical protein
MVARYVIGTKGHPVAVLLTLKEYDHYLDLLDGEADSQDDDLPRFWLRRLLGQLVRSDRPFETTCASARCPVPKYGAQGRFLSTGSR